MIGLQNTDERFIAAKNDQYFLIETRTFNVDTIGQPNGKSLQRMQQLSNILHEASIARFNILTCEEFFVDMDKKQLMDRRKDTSMSDRAVA